MNDIDGNPVSLETFRGKVVMIVNVASKCGFTKQYAGLEELFKSYQDSGFVVLGFPANNFLGQEPGTNEEIKNFCTLNYGVTFPMFAKISVKGKDQHPLYKYLTEKSTNPEFSGDISWNFNKFLIDRQGKIIARFGSRTKPEDDKVIAVIQNALK
ncbi:glutathione peroxidase [candidate division KSB1 bacterium]|nr:glutathione peroxidase [candidate division KSB1 bacterium]